MTTYYVGLDFHKASICIAVLSAAGKLVMESVVETGAATVLDFLKRPRGRIEVTFEDGTHAAWLYDVLRQTEAGVIVSDPRKNRLLQDGNKSDRVDARKLAQLLRAGLLSPVYHAEHGTRDLKELVRSYGKRQFWSYCGLAVVTKSSAGHHLVGAGLRRRQRSPAARGLMTSHNRTLKYVFKSAALTASRCEPFKSWHEELLARGLRPELARVTVARRIAPITLAVWKAGEAFDAGKLIGQAA